MRDLCSGDATLVPGALRGYRMWRQSGIDLYAVLRGRWDVEMTAACLPSLRKPASHEAPDETCNCGIYGWYRPGSTWRHASAGVFGVIEASGRVLLGERGFRAQRARIVALVLDDEEAADYWRAQGVAVFATRGELLAAFPPDDVSVLIGHEVPSDEDPGPVALDPQTLRPFVVQVQKVAAEYARSWQQVMEVAARAGSSMQQFINGLQVAGAIPPPAGDGDPKARALARKQPSTTPPMWADTPGRRRR